MRKYFLSYDRLKFVSFFTHTNTRKASTYFWLFKSQASYFSAITFKRYYLITLFAELNLNNLKKIHEEKSPTKKKMNKNRNILFLETKTNKILFQKSINALEPRKYFDSILNIYSYLYIHWPLCYSSVEQCVGWRIVGWPTVCEQNERKHHLFLSCKYRYHWYWDIHSLW